MIKKQELADRLLDMAADIESLRHHVKSTWWVYDELRCVAVVLAHTVRSINEERNVKNE